MGRPAHRAAGLSDSFFLALAIAWGFAEATVFFVVPDVIVTAAALRCRRLSLLAAACAAIAAVVGGMVMHHWGATDFGQAKYALERTPAIDAALVVRAGDQLRSGGLPALFIGAVSGTPYKLYAVHAGDQHVAIAPFLAASLLARLLRFAASALICRSVANTLPHWTLKQKAALLAAFWVVLYAIYWSVRGW